LKDGWSEGRLEHTVLSISITNNLQLVPPPDLPCLSRAKNNAKSSNLETFCRRTSRSFLCADYYGVGRSDGEFSNGNLSRWKEDSIQLMNSVMPGRKFVLVGAGVVSEGGGSEATTNGGKRCWFR